MVGKVPLGGSGVKERFTADPAEITELPWAQATGFAVSPGWKQAAVPRLAVVDLDAPEAFERAARFLDLQTFCVRTRKGAHFYFWTEDDIPYPKLPGWKIDLRCGSDSYYAGYVVGAGSAHPDGGFYRVDGQRPREIAHDGGGIAKMLEAFMADHGPPERPRGVGKPGTVLEALLAADSGVGWWEWMGKPLPKTAGWSRIKECPDPVHRNRQFSGFSTSKNAAVTVNAETGGWRCYSDSCPSGRGSVIDAVAGVKRITRGEAKELMLERAEMLRPGTRQEVLTKRREAYMTAAQDREDDLAARIEAHGRWVKTGQSEVGGFSVGATDDGEYLLLHIREGFEGWKAGEKHVITADTKNGEKVYEATVFMVGKKSAVAGFPQAEPLDEEDDLVAELGLYLGNRPVDKAPAADAGGDAAGPPSAESVAEMAMAAEQRPEPPPAPAETVEDEDDLDFGD